jgi:hypothetical protein
VVKVYNPRYSRGRDKEDHGSRLAGTKNLIPYPKRVGV